jgi:hypothetical protein
MLLKSAGPSLSTVIVRPPQGKVARAIISTKMRFFMPLSSVQYLLSVNISAPFASTPGLVPRFGPIRTGVCGTKKHRRLIYVHLHRRSVTVYFSEFANYFKLFIGSYWQFADWLLPTHCNICRFCLTQGAVVVKNGGTGRN